MLFKEFLRTCGRDSRTDRDIFCILFVLDLFEYACEFDERLSIVALACTFEKRIRR